MYTYRLLKYTALDSKGNKVSGEFYGDKESLLRFLQREGYLILDITEVKPKSRGKYSLDSFLLDLENLYFLLRAGTPLEEAINAVIKSSSNNKEIEFWESLKARVKSGMLFSDALLEAMRENGLSYFLSFVSLIKAAESMGELKTGILNYLSLVKRIQEIRANIINSLSYPGFLLFMTLIVLDIILVFIIPKFSAIFTSSDLSKLSFLSRIEIELGLWVNDHFKQSILISAFSLVSIVMIFVISWKKILVYLTRIPLIRDVVLAFDLSNLFSILSLSLKSGLTLLEALSISRDIVVSEEISQSIERLIDGLRGGRSLSESMQNLDVFPEDVKTVIETSEKSASLEEASELISSRYKEVLERKITIITKFIEPAVIIVIGIFIGFIIFGIINAILALTEVL